MNGLKHAQARTSAAREYHHAVLDIVRAAPDSTQAGAAIFSLVRTSSANEAHSPTATLQQKSAFSTTRKTPK
jgi:hypothetical protein